MGESRVRWLAAATVAASFFWMLGAAPLFDVDEGAFSQATLEMFQRGDFLSTYLNGQPRYDKPILVYWLQAAAVALFGPTEWAFRLPSALCATAWAGITYLFVRRRYGEERGLLAAVVLATSLGVFIIGRAATADALLNVLIAASMFAAWMHLSSGRRSWLYATHAAIGLGILAKGPIAVLVPLATTFIFCWLRRDVRTWARAVFDWRALLLLLAIALPWYIVILMKEGRGFVEGFFFKHNLGRFSGPVSGHAGSLFYYFPVILLLSLPFTALIVPVFTRIRTVWRDDLQAYLLIWFGFVFVFFSLSGTKLPHYVLYGYTALVVLMAVNGADLKSVFWPLVPVLLFFVGLIALPYGLTFAKDRVADALYGEVFAASLQYFDTVYFAFLAIMCALVLYAMIERRTSLPRKLAIFGLAAVASLATLVVPIAGFAQQSSIREAALLCRERNLDAVMWRLNAPSFSVYRGAPTPSRDPRPGDVVVTRSDRLRQLPPGLAYDLLYSKRGIVLARMRP
ncbi:MAG TPA: glycosyltransferase family 39 protein [Burkholderiales bacterium]|nr:glycosyltransferase family 39 protein [Burkholderiales bacterium]